MKYLILDKRQRVKNSNEGNDEGVIVYIEILAVQSQRKVARGEGNVPDIDVETQKCTDRPGCAKKDPKPEIRDDSCPVFGVVNRQVACEARPEDRG